MVRRFEVGQEATAKEAVDMRAPMLDLLWQAQSRLSLGWCAVVLFWSEVSRLGTHEAVSCSCLGRLQGLEGQRLGDWLIREESSKRMQESEGCSSRKSKGNARKQMVDNMGYDLATVEQPLPQLILHLQHA